jgi:hypothetical protein
MQSIPKKLHEGNLNFFYKIPFQRNQAPVTAKKTCQILKIYRRQWSYKTAPVNATCRARSVSTLFQPQLHLPIVCYTSVYIRKPADESDAIKICIKATRGNLQTQLKIFKKIIDTPKLPLKRKFFLKKLCVVP